MKIIPIWSQTIIFIYTSNYQKSFANFAPLISKVIMQKTSITEIMGKFSNKILEYVYTYLFTIKSRLWTLYIRTIPNFKLFTLSTSTMNETINGCEWTIISSMRFGKRKVVRRTVWVWFHMFRDCRLKA